MGQLPMFASVDYLSGDTEFLVLLLGIDVLARRFWLFWSGVSFGDCGLNVGNGWLATNFIGDLLLLSAG